MRAALSQNVGSYAEVFDQRELERAGPGPELPDGQWRHRLERRHEPVEPLSIEAPRAAADQLEGQCVHTWQAREFIGGDHRKPPKEGRRQIVMNVARRRRDNVE